jgi:hypothetical protein
MNNRQLLLAGAIGGLALGIAALFSTLTAASAQMMQHQGMDMSAMGFGMPMVGGAHQHAAMFSGSGHSAISNVQVTGIAATGNNEATVYLRYTGTGAAPSVVIVVHTNKDEMMSMMHGRVSGMGGMGMMGQGNMMGGMSSMQWSGYPTWTNAQWQQWHTQMAHQLAFSNSTQWQDWHNQMMTNPTWLNSTLAVPQAPSVLIGSTAIGAGWNNGTFKVKLQGDGSAYDAADIMAMVFPLTS